LTDPVLTQQLRKHDLFGENTTWIEEEEEEDHPQLNESVDNEETVMFQEWEWSIGTMQYRSPHRVAASGRDHCDNRQRDAASSGSMPRVIPTVKLVISSQFMGQDIHVQGCGQFGDSGIISNSGTNPKSWNNCKTLNNF
jgi:hypothetical protein